MNLSVSTRDVLDVAVALDPIALMLRAGFVPDPWQRRVLEENERTLVLAGRQAGKGLAAAVKATHRAAFVDDQVVIVVDPAQRQAKHLLSKCTALLPYIGRVAAGATNTTEDIRFRNGSRIVAIPGLAATVRGLTANLVVIDEACWLPIATWEAIVPSLAATSGDVLILSSAGAPSGWFYQLWLDTSQPWTRIKATAHDISRIDPEWLELQKRSMPRDWFAREFLCEFVAVEGSVFRPDDVAGAIAPLDDPWGPMETE